MLRESVHKHITELHSQYVSN